MSWTVATEAARILITAREVGGAYARAVPRPFFVGSPGAGKTWATREFSRALGLPFVSVRPAQLSREDFAGYSRLPRGREPRDRLVPLRPEWWHGGPAVLLLDEIDKARKEHLAALLSLLEDGELRGFAWKGPIVGAGNEDTALFEDPTAAALWRRLAALPVAAEPLAELDVGFDLSALFPRRPVLCPGPDQVSRATQAALWTLARGPAASDFWRAAPEVRQALVAALVPPDGREAVLQGLQGGVDPLQVQAEAYLSLRSKGNGR